MNYFQDCFSCKHLVPPLEMPHFSSRGYPRSFVNDYYLSVGIWQGLLPRPALERSGGHHEWLGLFKCGNSSSSTEVKTFEGCHGIGKPQDFLDLPILEEAVNESSVE